MSPAGDAGERLQEWIQHPPGWLPAGEGGEGILISVRVRLARDLAGRSFPQHADLEERETIGRQVRTALEENAGALSGGVWLDLGELSERDRRLLVERRLVGPTLAEGTGPRGIYVGPGERCSATINGTDHLRLQAVSGGEELKEAWRIVDGLDDGLGRRLRFAWRPDLGFMTASPADVGTGLRAEVLLHLPGLVLTADAEAVLQGVARVGMNVRGLYGEGRAVHGNLFRIFNQMTLGRSETDVLGSVDRVVRQVAETERKARATLWTEARSETEDKLHRALGVLRNARLLSVREGLNLLSAVRMGLNMDVLSGVQIDRLNKLQVLMLPAHLARWEGRDLDPAEQDFLRAALVRSELAAEGGGTA
jgi:protein arginine kinase